MTLLVTGGAGYIGSHMVLALVDQGRRVVVLDNLSTGVRAAVPDGADLVIGDVGDRELVSRLLAEYAVTDVAHFAASCVVPDSVRDPAAYYRNNTFNAFSLIEEAARAGVSRFLFSSTAAVYAEAGDGLVSEDAKIDPLTPYGASKLMTERILTDIGSSTGMSTGVLRYFNVAGADPKGRAGQSTSNATHLIKVCVEAAAGKRTNVEIFGSDFPTKDGTGVRDFIHVADLISAHIATLDALTRDASNLVLNCGYGRGFSVLDVIQATERVSGRKIEVRWSPRRPGDLSRVVADGSRLRAELGWEPEYENLESIIEHALSWERRLSNARPEGGS